MRLPVAAAYAMLRCLYLRRLKGFEKGIFRMIVKERFGFWRDSMLGRRWRFGSELMMG
jgi:hypothetical protein